MIRTSTWLVAAGQLALLIGLSSCYLAAPSLVHTAEGGISNYGVHRPTVALYTSAWVLGTLGTCLAAYFAARQSPLLAALLATLAVLYVAVLLSTYGYQHSHAQRELHIILGAALYTTQLGAGVWLAWQPHTSPAVSALLAIQVAGSALSLASLLHIVPLLLVGQAITAVSFGVALTILVQRTLTL